MLNFFPRIYEGELLYSIVSRYKLKAGIINKKALMKDLYGKEVTLNSIYFPVHIEALISNMPPNIVINEKDIIENNTLFKIFSAFLD